MLALKTICVFSKQTITTTKSYLLVYFEKNDMVKTQLFEKSVHAKSRLALIFIDCLRVY